MSLSLLEGIILICFNREREKYDTGNVAALRDHYGRDHCTRAKGRKSVKR